MNCLQRINKIPNLQTKLNFNITGYKTARWFSSNVSKTSASAISGHVDTDKGNKKEVLTNFFRYFFINYSPRGDFEVFFG